MSSSTPLTRPVAAGLFAPPDGAGQLPWLLGSRCERCGELVFPAMRDCPACVSHNSMVSHRLRGRGRVARFVVARHGPQGFVTPYIQAFVQLDDGPLVYSLIDGCEPRDDALEAGQIVEMSITTVRRDGDIDVIGWKFHPLDARDADHR